MYEGGGCVNKGLLKGQVTCGSESMMLECFDTEEEMNARFDELGLVEEED